MSFMNERHIGNAQMNSTLVCLGWSCRKDRTSCVLVAILSATAVPALTPGDVLSTLPHTSLRLPFVQGKFVQNAVKWAAGGKAFGIRVAVADTSWSTGVLERLVANVCLGGEGQGVQATGSEGQRHQQPHRGRVTSVALSCPSLSRVKLTRLAILVQDSAMFTSAGAVAVKDISVDVADVLLVSRGASEQLSSQAKPCDGTEAASPPESSCLAASPCPPQINGQDAAVGTYAWKLMQFLTAGGGVLIGAETTSWVNAKKALVDHPANKFLRPLVGAGCIGARSRWEAVVCRAYRRYGSICTPWDSTSGELAQCHASLYTCRPCCRRAIACMPTARQHHLCYLPSIWQGIIIHNAQSTLDINK